MFLNDLPDAARKLIETYDENMGVYRKPDGSLDAYPTELETLGVWYHFARCIKAQTVLETGTYVGLGTCVIAAALAKQKNPAAKIYTIDPWNIPHLWDNSHLAPLVSYLPHTSQDAAPQLKNIPLDILIIDSIHDYKQSSWELMTFEPQVREGGYILMHDSLYYDGTGRTARHLYDNPRFEVMTFETPRAVYIDQQKSGALCMGCTVARKIRHGAPIVQDPTWLAIPWSDYPAARESFLRIRARETSGA
jgi:predicted O-methyltransferase YrrM